MAPIGCVTNSEITKPSANLRYVAVAPFKFNVASGEPSDIRKMGNVVRFEYLCLARFVELFGKLPKFNNKKEAPKYSLTVGRARKARSVKGLGAF